MQEIFPFGKWVATNPKLTELIEMLDNSNKPFDEQAKIGFYEISELLGVPKYPEEISEEDYEKYEIKGIENPTTVFEEIGKLRFCMPTDDIRGIVLLAIYNSNYGLPYGIDNCAQVYFGSIEQIPKDYIVYYSGQDIDSMIHFLEESESWTKPGIKYAVKIVSNFQ